MLITSSLEWTAEFLKKVRPLYQAHLHLSAEEVVVFAGCTVLVEVDDTEELIVGDLEGILGHHFGPCLIHNLNIIFICYYIILLVNRQLSTLREER